MAQTRLDRRKRLEALEQRVYNVVKKVIDAKDPESLIKMGAPDDEYDDASKYIARAIVREGVGGLNRTGLAYIVCFTFHLEFNQWTEPPKMHGLYFEIADKMLPLLPRIRR